MFTKKNRSNIPEFEIESLSETGEFTNVIIADNIKMQQYVNSRIEPNKDPEEFRLKAVDLIIDFLESIK